MNVGGVSRKLKNNNNKAVIANHTVEKNKEAMKVNFSYHNDIVKLTIRYA